MFIEILDAKDIYVIEESFESYENNSNQDEPLLQFETDLLQESRNYSIFIIVSVSILVCYVMITVDIKIVI